VASAAVVASYVLAIAVGLVALVPLVLLSFALRVNDRAIAWHDAGRWSDDSRTGNEPI
jgi:hypothetical protein